MKLLVLLMLVTAGCADGDPCSGHGGACLGVRVVAGPAVDQLRIVLAGAVTADEVTPATPGPLQTPPLTTAVYLPAVSGVAELTVEGRAAGAVVGGAVVGVALTPNRHQTVDVSLTGSGYDLGGDLAGADLNVTDLALVDQAMPPVRHIFLLSARNGALGTLDSLHTACSTEGAAVGSGVFKALVAYPTMSPSDYITLSNLSIVLPSGAAVTDDSTFFTPTHVGAIDELADGTPATNTCVWTEFNANGDHIISSTDCNGWTDNTVTFAGGSGDDTATDISWSFASVNTCDALCYVYCLEQN